MSYILLEQPLTLEQIKSKSADNFVEGIVKIDLQTIIERDFEGFLDLLEEKLIGDLGIVTDLEYNVVGNGMSDELHIRATGFADLCNTD